MSKLAERKQSIQAAQPELNQLQRKVRKLKRDPKQFVLDSKAYIGTRRAAYITWAKLGSFAIVLAASVLVVAYYFFVASPRFATISQFVVKESGSNEMALMGLAAIGSTSSSMRDALIIKEYIESREMAEYLDNTIHLRKHYQSSEWDFISRLAGGAPIEDFLKYYRDHINVRHDELSDIVHIEVQAFTPEFSLLMANTLLEKSEIFINSLGDKMAKEQLKYAQDEVERLYINMKKQQETLLHFQNNNELYSPEEQGSALMAAIGTLQANIITAQAKLKEMLAVMRDDAAEVESQRILINSLEQQLREEQGKLTSEDQRSLNKINANYQEIKLNAELATGLYQAALSGMEAVRAEAYRKLKHLLIVQKPLQPENNEYPRRVYSVVTWFVSLMILFLIGRLIIAVINEHKE